MAIGAANKLTEQLLVKTWQEQLPSRTDLVTEDGKPVKIIYPGRINDDRGADCLDAVIAIGSRVVKGNIEIHVRSSSWWEHQHHLDPNYNHVILHVVFYHDAKADASLQNGQRVPTLALQKYIKNPADLCTDEPSQPDSVMPCSKAMVRLNKDFMIEFLDRAGEERFLTKSASFQTDLVRTEASQTLYQGIMVALGYTRNKFPFLELARRVPLMTLTAITQAKISAIACLAQQQALLMGTAGLLPSQCDHWHRASGISSYWAGQLEKTWLSSPQAESMSESDWHLFKVRPNNFPTRRIAAMSYLTLRYQERGILEGMVNKIREIPLNSIYPELARALMVTTDANWATTLVIPTLLGRGRAAEIVVNVLLPFIFAWGRINSPTELRQKTLHLYRHHPRLAVNTMERHMAKQMGINSDLVDSAQRQQGLIHIYKTLCSQGKCDCCPLGEMIR